MNGEPVRLAAPDPSSRRDGPSVARVLLEGRPGVGKTTAARRLLDLMRRDGIAVGGFTTVELREAGRRVGFAVETVNGDRAVLAHVGRPGPPRVGKYGVDVAAFERLAMPALAAPAQLVVIDELGKMELTSAAFRAAVRDVFTRPVDVVAAVHAFAHPVTDELKARPDVEVLRITLHNRDSVPDQLRRRLHR